MGLKEKVWQTLSDYFTPDEMVLNDDEAITGFLVSPRFKKMETLDRMDLVDTALATGKFTRRERGKILLIAPLTPAEYKAVAPREPQPPRKPRIKANGKH